MNPLRIGPISSLQDVTRAMADIQAWANVIESVTAEMFNRPGADELKFLVLEDTGLVKQWTLVAGAGVTLDFDTSTRTCTLTSP